MWSHSKISSCIVASVFGSRSREITSQPCETKADPTEPCRRLVLKVSYRRDRTLDMEYTLTQSDIEFMKWLDSKECEHYWVKDETGERKRS